MLDNGEPVGCRPRRADSHLISWNSYLNPEAHCLTVVILPVFASAFKKKKTKHRKGQRSFPFLFLKQTK